MKYQVNANLSIGIPLLILITLLAISTMYLGSVLIAWLIILGFSLDYSPWLAGLGVLGTVLLIRSLWR